VTLSVTVGPDGRVADIAVAKSSGFDRLDKAALEAVRHWRWSPTMRNGEAVAIKGYLPFPFVLQG
jgi:protein TonB